MKNTSNILRLILSYIAFIASQAVYCQAGTAKIEIVADERVQVLLDKHLEINNTKKYIQGFRIQLFSESGANSKTAALDMKTKFLAKFPNQETYIVFVEPNYKLRVGNFRTRMNARGFLKEIIAEYPNAYVIKDIIEFPQE
ncbi:MAG: SPOR domain-containing protein [Bacteroidota bacterium]